MNIGAASDLSGVPPKTIRYCESIGLIPAAIRAENGYRAYVQDEVETLRFINRARRMGFSVKDVGSLLGLWADRKRSSADVKAVALRHIDEIDDRISELKSIRRTLEDLSRKNI